MQLVLTPELHWKWGKPCEMREKPLHTILPIPTPVLESEGLSETHSLDGRLSIHAQSFFLLSYDNPTQQLSEGTTSWRNFCKGNNRPYNKISLWLVKNKKGNSPKFLCHSLLAYPPTAQFHCAYFLKWIPTSSTFKLKLCQFNKLFIIKSPGVLRYWVHGSICAYVS